MGCNSPDCSPRKFVLIDREENDRCDSQDHAKQLERIHPLMVDKQTYFSRFCNCSKKRWTSGSGHAHPSFLLDPLLEEPDFQIAESDICGTLIAVGDPTKPARLVGAIGDALNEMLIHIDVKCVLLCNQRYFIGLRIARLHIAGATGIKPLGSVGFLIVIEIEGIIAGEIDLEVVKEAIVASKHDAAVVAGENGHVHLERKVAESLADFAAGVKEMDGYLLVVVAAIFEATEVLAGIGVLVPLHTALMI